MNRAKGQGYRWYVLTLAALASMFVTGWAWVSLPPLFGEIAEDLDLSLAQIGAVWGTVSLAGIFMAFPSGLLGDRFGVRRMGTIGLVLTGIASGLRGLSSSLTMLIALMFLFGACMRLVGPIETKALRTWFEPRQLGLAMGTQTAAVGLGGALAVRFAATWLSPALGGWRQVMFLFGVIIVVLGVLWALTIRERPSPNLRGASGEEGEIRRIPFKEAFLRVIRLKDIWLIGVSMLGIVSLNAPVVAYLPLYFERGGMPVAEAHSLASYWLWAFLVGNLTLPRLSDSLGLRKVVFFPSAVLLSVSAFLLPLLTGFPLSLSVIALGFFGAGALAPHTIVVTEMKQIGATYAATAVGLTGLISGVGGFLSPILGGMLADANIAHPFLFWGALPLLSIICFSLVKETGWRAKQTGLVGSTKAGG